MEFTDICLITEDVKKLVEFYKGIFNVKGEGDEVHSFLTIAGLGLAIYSKKAAEEDMNFDFTDSGVGLMTIGFNVDDVEEEHQRMKKYNLEGITEPKTWPWGARSFNFRDPDGNRIVFRSWPKG